MIKLGTKFHPTWDGKPPHMAPKDYDIWIRARKGFTFEAAAMYFDVGLGGQEIPDKQLSPQMFDMWQRVTQKRIDVLVETPHMWQIIEVRFNANSSAVGRLMMYDLMWKSERPDNRPYLLYLITNRQDDDLERLCTISKIGYIVI